jgi:hypothetical protein
MTVKANLTWRAAAKFYIWAVGMAATLTASQTDLPEWVTSALGIATLVAGWLKKQYPVTEVTAKSD